MIFARSLTETIPLKKPKNPKSNPETWYVNKKISVIVDCYHWKGN